MVYSVCCLVLPEPTPPSKPEPMQKPAREPAKPSPAASTDTRGKHYLFSPHTFSLSFCSNSFSHQHTHTFSPLKKVHLCCDVCLLIVWSVCERFLCDLITKPESHLVCCFLWPQRGMRVRYHCYHDRRAAIQKHWGFDPWGWQISIISLIFFLRFFFHLGCFSSFYYLFPLHTFVPSLRCCSFAPTLSHTLSVRLFVPLFFLPPNARLKVSEFVLPWWQQVEGSPWRQ